MGPRVHGRSPGEGHQDARKGERHARFLLGVNRPWRPGQPGRHPRGSE